MAKLEGVSLKHVGSLLARARDFDGVYLENLKDIYKAIANANGTKVDLKIGVENEDSAREYIKFSALANDLTTTSLIGGSNVTIQVFTEEGTARAFGVEELAIRAPEDRLKELYSDKGELQVAAALVRRNDEWSSEFTNDVAPLVEAGRVFIRPQRGLISLKETLEDGRRHFHVHQVAETDAFDFWDMESEERGSRSTPMVVGSRTKENEAALFAVSVPFISGVSFSELALLLDDEEHHISKLRSALGEVVQKAAVEDRKSDQVIADILRPELDGLTRRFKTAAQSKAWRVSGAAISTATLALVAVATNGIPSALAALGGASGFGLLASEKASQIEKTAALKEHPMYLLWRCQQIAKASSKDR